MTQTSAGLSIAAIIRAAKTTFSQVLPMLMMWMPGRRRRQFDVEEIRDDTHRPPYVSRHTVPSACRSFLSQCGIVQTGGAGYRPPSHSTLLAVSTCFLGKKSQLHPRGQHPIHHRFTDILLRSSSIKGIKRHSHCWTLWSLVLKSLEDVEQRRRRR